MNVSVSFLILILFFSSFIVAEENSSLVPDRDLVYYTEGDTCLRLHVFEPQGHSCSDTRPAIVFFHRGGWKNGTPMQLFPHCHYLVSRGIVAMAAECRLFSKHGTSPRECVIDGKTAIRWVRSHAHKLGINPSMVAAGSGSAGGHVAAATGILKKLGENEEGFNLSSRPDAFVLLNTVFDNDPEGFGYSNVKNYWREASPLRNIYAAAPPTIVFLGTKDALIPVETGRAYQRAMKKVGVRCDL